MAALLHTDFTYLLRRAEALSRECKQGMGTLAHISVLEESRRSADNAMRVEKLTILASIFIPLSFVCAAWGMNFVELGTGSLPIWMGFVTAGPVVVLSLPVYRIDLVKRLFEKAQRRISGRKEMALQ
jgi:Mg2+ and Co2+ transporter CorA